MNLVWAGNAIPPRISEVTITDGAFCGTVSGRLGVSYIVQGATNLALPVWENLSTNQAPFRFSEPAGLPGRYYRAIPQTLLSQ